MWFRGAGLSEDGERERRLKVEVVVGVSSSAVMGCSI